jgi:glycosyltransferase involved in cell wall biosynthesis
VPVHNETEAIPLFFAAIDPVLRTVEATWEIVFVDDGSTDETRSVLARRMSSDPRLVVVELSRNFGKEAALTAGLDHATGDAVILIDADLQDPPELIPTFVAHWRAGSDVVYGLRSSRRTDSAAKRLTASAFYAAFNRLSPLKIAHDAGDFRLMDRRVADALRSLREQNRFMKGLYAWVGFSSVAVPFERRPRAGGETKFSLWRLWNFAMDGITAFSTLPLRLWTYIGIGLSMLSFVYALFLIFLVLETGRDVPGYASIMVSVLFLGGVQLFSLGIIGEYLGRIYQESKGRPVYVVERVRTNGPQPHQLAESPDGP